MTLRIVTPEVTGQDWPPQHYNPSRTAVFDGVTYRLSAGSSDAVYFVREVGSDAVHVVSYNTAHGYVGVGILDPDEDDEDRGVIPERSIWFDQNAEQRVLDLRPTTLVRRTLQGVEV